MACPLITYSLDYAFAVRAVALGVGEAETRNGCKVVIGKWEGFEIVRRAWHGLKDWIEIDLRRAGCENVSCLVIMANI